MKKYFLVFIFYFHVKIYKKTSYIIPDFLLVPVYIYRNLFNYFIFENNLVTFPIEFFIAEKYNLSNLNSGSFIIVENNIQYHIQVLAKSETEILLDTPQFIPLKKETKFNIDTTQSKFLAIIIKDALGEDMLNTNLLYYQKTLIFLQQLKKEYLFQ